MANYFLDRTNKNGDLAGTWTFTNGSASVAGSNGNAQTLGLGAGDYIKPNGTDEWYKIASVGGENGITLAYNFAQANQTSVTANYADVSVNNGSTTGKAFVHINQFTTDTARSAGDVLYVRRNQTHLHMQAIDITFDENGTITSPIEVVGDNGTGWAGDSNVKPIFDFNTGSRYFSLSKTYWNFRRLIFNGGDNGYGHCLVGAAFNWFYDCTFQHCTGGAYGATFLFNGNNFYFENCVWSGNVNNSLTHYQGTFAKIVNCTFDGNANCISNSGAGAVIELINCTFGVSVANSGSNIGCGQNLLQLLEIVLLNQPQLNWSQVA